MAINGNIEIKNSLKAYVEADDLILVDRSKLSLGQEARLYFEICLAITMCFMGLTIANFQIWLLVITILFGALSIFFIVRFIKYKKIGKVVELEGVFKYGTSEEAN